MLILGYIFSIEKINNSVVINHFLFLPLSDYILLLIFKTSTKVFIDSINRVASCSECVRTTSTDKFKLPSYFISTQNDPLSSSGWAPFISGTNTLPFSISVEASLHTKASDRSSFTCVKLYEKLCEEEE